MAAVVAVVAKVVGVIAGVIKAGGVAASILKFAATTVLSIGVSKLIAKRAMSGADAGADAGGRVQLPPATDNKLPVIYGSAFVGGAIVDAMISDDQKTMWYVVALAEHTNSTVGSGYTYDTTKCYYDGKLIEFGANGRVTGLITNNTDPITAQKDTRVDGYLYIYLFTNGSNSCQNAPYTAAQILSTANGVPSQHAWGANQTMTNAAFAIIKVIYNTNAGITSSGSLTVKLTNSITRPGDAILDYMLNERYGCAIPLNRIDTVSLDALNDYSDELIEYIPANGNSTPPLPTQSRYTINGPLDTGATCLDNLQKLVDSCDSWLQYSELTGLWRVVMNKGYDQAPNAQTINDLFLINSSNLVGGIDISPLDLNETYNQIEVAYPNTNIKDQTDYQIIDLFQEDPQILNPNEAVNRINVTLPLVNNAVQARYLAARRIYQSREDLVIGFRTDFSGIQIEAGDIIRVTHEVYGWTNKLFRVSTVAEEKDPDGNLYAAVQAFEYNNDIFDDIVQDFVPSFNTGLLNPNVIDKPGTPTATINPDTDGLISSFTITSSVPNFGTVMYMDFNYGSNSNVLSHQLYRKIQTADGLPFTNSNSNANVFSNISVTVNDLPAGTYYFSTTARNDIAGRISNSSTSFFWTGANINPANIVTGTGVYSNGNMLYSNIAFSNLTVNANVYLTNGVGQLANNTYITNVANSTHFFVTPTPIIALSNSNIEIISGGIPGNLITPNTLPGNRVIANTLNGNSIILGTANGNIIINGTITNVQIANDTITTPKLVANIIKAGYIDANAITAGTIAAGAITAGTIAAGAITANTIAANAVTAGTIAAGAVTANTIAAGAVTANTIAANAVTAGTIAAGAVTAGTIAAGAITAGSLAAGSVTANEIAANAVTTSKLEAFAVTAGKIQSGAITATQIAANTITFENLVIGAVTQAKSTTSDPVILNIPFYNWPTLPKTWPDNTRCIVPAGGVTIIPSTDPTSSANTEYVQGSRIEVGFSVKFYTDPTRSAYNLIEIWKSGASSVFDRGFNTIRHSYVQNAAGSGRSQTIHGYGYGQYDLYSADGGNTWATYAPGASSTTITGAVNYNTGNTLASMNTLEVGYVQNTTLYGNVSAGQRSGNSGSASPIGLGVNIVGLSYGGITQRYYNYNALEFMPYTGGNGYTNSYPELLAIGTNGLIWYSQTISDQGYAETSGTLKTLYGVYGNQPTSGVYTAIIAGQTGTILKSSRSVGSSAAWSGKSTYVNGNVANPVITDFYDVAGDNSPQSGSSKWVAVGQYAMLQVSVNDGENWTQVQTPITDNLNAVRYGNGKWVAIGDNGNILINSGNVLSSTDWLQIDTSNLVYTNNSPYGNIVGRNLNTLDYSPVYDTFNIGGDGIILNIASGSTTPKVAYDVAPAEDLSLTRLTYFGSYANVSQVSPAPPNAQQILNNQVFSGTVVDTAYVQGQETTYYLVIGNMNGANVQAGQVYLQVQEIKR